MKDLSAFDIVPINTSTLKVVLCDYQYPVDKIKRLVNEGTLIPIKKGLYVLSESTRKHNISKELLGNHIYGPSYVTMDYALAYYSLIPESVNNITSVTIKRSRSFETAFGKFIYRQADTNYYSIGINIEKVNNLYHFLIASPEKAICDKIIFTPQLKLTSLKSLQDFLTHDLRIEENDIAGLNSEIVAQCMTSGIKRRELALLIQTIKKKKHEYS